MKVLICKITNKEFQDTENRSGIITEHLRSISIAVPSSFLRRQYLKKTNIPWHFQYFNILEREEKEKFKCKYCDWETFDLDNKSGCYTIHIKEVHNKNIKEYLAQFPSESIKFSTFLNKHVNKIETEKKDNHVECKICKLKVRYLTNTHLKKHNITPEEYKKKYGIQDYASVDFKKNSRGILAEAAKKIKKSYVSKPEKDLKYFISNELSLNIKSNDKNLLEGVELDIVIPDKKICIEFNGNLYHSENYGRKKRFFHLNKTDLCKEKGYKLIHIMEDEWFLKNNIVKEKLKNILNVNNKPSIYARKCIIKEITTKDKNNFLEKNHIQGQDKSEIYLGAFYENNLISVMTFSSNRKMVKIDQNKAYELKRFASDINFRVIGIFSKMISFFSKHYEYDSIFTFLDLRWNSNEHENVYTKNGFILDKHIKPDYSYYNSKISRYKRFHKFSFGKKALKKRFPEIYSDEKTEWEIMQEAGYDRIWDCGKYKYIFN